ncbi:DUF445 family protein [Deferrisoma sp.]
MNEKLWAVAAAPVFGFVIGYATNALAIRMLFRPYEERRFLGLRFQGMIPRRKDEIARKVAEVVTTELLREERVAERLAGAEVRGPLADLVVDLAGRYLGPGARSWWAAPEHREAAGRAVEAVVRETAKGLTEWFRTPDGRAALRELADRVLGLAPAQLLPGEQGVLRRVAAGKAAELLASPDLESRVRLGLDRLVVRLAGVDRPLREVLPPEIAGALRSAVDPLVDPLLQRFEEAVLSPANVERIKGAVRAGIVGYLAEVKGGLVKNAIRHAALLARERIFREADEIVDQNLFRLRELVRQEEHRQRIREGILEAVDRLLARTPGEVLAGLPPEVLDRVYGQAASWVVGRLRRPEVAEALLGLLERELERWYGAPLRTSLGDAAGRWADYAARWIEGGGLERLADREAPRFAKLAREALARGGVPPPSEAFVREVASLALDRLLPIVAEQVPALLGIVDVRGLVEQQIRGFSAAEVERVILQVARRELRAITWWGGVLGALVGGVQAGLLLMGG